MLFKKGNIPYYKLHPELAPTGKNHWAWIPREIRICPICDKQFESRIDLSKKTCSGHCGGELRRRLYSGKNSWNWKGGKRLGSKRVASTYWRKLRRTILIRDEYECRICKNKRTVLIVHHIVPHKVNQNDNPNNLITLCSPCHRQEDYRMQANERLKEEYRAK